MSAAAYQRGQWIGNGKRAYRVVHFTHNRQSVVLLGPYAVKFVTTCADLVSGGYKPLRRRPRYAWTSQ